MGAIDGVKLGNLTAMLRHFDRAIAASRNVPGEHNSKNGALVQAVADANAKIAAEDLAAKSEVLGDLVTREELRIVAAMSDIATGRVSFFS